MSLSITCTTDLAVDTIVWVANDMEIVTSTRDSTLTLHIEKITERNHNMKYTCLVSSSFGNQSDTITLFVVSRSSFVADNLVGVVIGVIIAILLTGAGFILIVFVIRR